MSILNFAQFLVVYALKNHNKLYFDIFFVFSLLFASSCANIFSREILSFCINPH